MCKRAFAVLLAVLFPAAADQMTEHVFNLTQAHTPQSLQKVVKAVRSVAGIRQLSLDVPRKSVTILGTPDQARTVEWLISALDQPATVPQEFTMPGGADERIRVFRLTNAKTYPDLSELEMLVRSLADAQHTSTYTPLQALVLRGTAWRISLAAWMLGELDQPASARPPVAPPEYRLQSGIDILPPNDVYVRIFYTPARTPEALLDMFTSMRSAVKYLPRSCTYTPRGAIVVRTSSEKMAAAEQALQQKQAH